MGSRQYIEEAWTRFSVTAGDESVLCNFNGDPGRGGDATLCVIPTQARGVVEDPVSMKEKPNVMTQWLDRLTAAGASTLLVHGKWFDDLWKLADLVRAGQDGFAGMEKRIRIAIDESLNRGYVKPGKILVMGSSRHGFAILHAMANNTVIDGAVAHQPIVHWPHMEEFHGMDDDPIIDKNSLYQWVERFVPRPVLIQTGYADKRVGSNWLQKLIDAMAAAYRTQGVEASFSHDLMDLPGHDGTRIPDWALDSVVRWPAGQGLL